MIYVTPIQIPGLPYLQQRLRLRPVESNAKLEIKDVPGGGNRSKEQN
jgi:hypothetical protein